MESYRSEEDSFAKRLARARNFGTVSSFVSETRNAKEMRCFG